MFRLLKRMPDPDQVERGRLDALARLQILDTEREDDFDSLAHLAAGLFRAPMASVSLLTHDRQWFKARVGLDSTETPRNISFCTHTIQSDEVMVVLDTLQDARFADNPLVRGPPLIRFYAGAPLITSDRYRLGTLCIFDKSPREGFPRRDRNVMSYLASLVVKQIERRLERRSVNYHFPLKKLEWRHL